MSTGVYGSAITEETVRLIPPYDEPPDRVITKYDMSTVALDMINAEDKEKSARDYLDQQADDYGHTNGVATKGLIYNATGETMTFVKSHDYAGHFGDAMPPTEIQNGQWGVFFHHKPPIIMDASEGALVYRLSSMDSMVCWWSRWAGQNHCYAELREVGHFIDDYWDYIEDKMWNVTDYKWTEQRSPTQLDIVIGDDSICECSAILKLTQ